ncbi:S-layer homology domain-containing protein [Paenibacillus sp. BC26]|uniref:S-layer homology domain-containing protein n=1 Tax=Paenibacillus sp. BC26 TaxID=1881032 RepID=UPI0008F0C3EE|nr:S-layer homology domain-containing protein [Paenibacillus sp. BC26]SFS61610.1 S-layer homology domain-containing protein [Paenibacillus sp. BC26]
MPQQKKWVKVVSSMLVFSVLTGFSAVGGSLAYADSASPSRFSDVPAGHWAEKHIAKLATQGIVKGTNGAFKPSDNVSQQEAIALAIRFIGKEQDVKVDDAIVFPDTFEVSTYFKPYIILAFQAGLLDQKEEFELAEANPKSAWGTQKATREWITKLIVKAIGKQKEAEALANDAISFSDGSKVGSDYKGYVNAAVSLQLIKGITADRFDPKGFITRASIATIFSRAETQFPVSYTGQQTAVMTSIDATSVHLYQNDKESAIEMTPDTYVYRFDSEKPSKVADLEPNTKLLVISSGNKALYVEQLDAAKQVEKLKGTVDRVLVNDSKIWVWINDEPVAITYNSATVVTDGAGAVIKPSALAKDSEVEITRDTYRTKPQALSIKVQSAPINNNGQGTISAIDTASSAVTVKDSVTGTEYKYNVSPQVDVIWQGQILDGGLSQLRVGDAISYEVKNSLVTKITITQTSAKLIRGEFYSASSDGKTIQYVKNAGTAQSALEAKFVSILVDVTIDGLTGTTIADLVKGDILDISLNSNDQVVAIKVVNRNVTLMIGATVRNYESDTRILDFKDKDGNPMSVYLTDKTRIDLNGSTVAVSAAGSLLVKNRKLTIGVTDNKAVLIQFVYKYSGTVAAINTSQVSITQSNGAIITLPLELPNSIEIAGKSSSTVSDVKAGDTVTGLLNANQDKVITLQVHTSLQSSVFSTDVAGKRLRVKTSDGSILDLNAAAMDIYNERGDKITLADLKAGQTGNVQYVGLTPVAYKLVKVTYGKLTAVNASSLAIVDNSGVVTSVTLGDSYTVVKNGLTGSSSAVLQVGDRVEVKKDAKDRVVVTVNSGISKKFWKYNAATGELSVKRATLTELNTYAVTSATKVTQGDQQIAISQLKDGDAILLYFYQNVLVEIAKV